MAIRIQYADAAERQAIIAAQVAAGNALTMEENVRAGNFLTFSTAEELNIKVVVEKTLHAFFNHENRIRALEGKAAITREQFIQAVKNL